MSSPSTHPLLARPFSFIQSWKEWLELWQNARHLETLQGLLHFGFQVNMNSTNECLDRLAFYLEVADGHLDSDTFRSLRGDRLYPSYSENTHIRTSMGKGWPEGAFCATASRAFVALCQHVFRPEDGKEKDESFTPGVSYMPDWARYTVHRAALEKLVWFFRPKEDKSGRGPHQLHNVDGYHQHDVGKHNLQTGRRFAFDLARYIFRAEADRHDDPIEELLVPFRPAAVNILCAQYRLDILLHADYRERLDKACIARIKELALETWILGEAHRQVKTLEEACLAGSQAAKIYLLLQTMQKEKKRQKHIADLKFRRQQADAELLRLSK